MFPQIVSHLSITPQAVNQLVFYGRRLAAEDITRKLAAFFAVILVGLQIAVIAAPPSPANAASPNDIIHGGFTNKADMLTIYDTHPNLRDLLDYFGISRRDIVNSHEDEINSSDHSLLSLGRTPHSGDVKIIHCCGDTFYLRPLYVWDSTPYTIANGSTYKALVGRRAIDGGFFALMNACGNIVVRKLPPRVVTGPPITMSFACTDLKASTTSGKAPLTVNFTATATATHDSIKEYLWDFGDSTTATTTGNRTSHTYKKAGRYTARLRVKDSIGKISPYATACSVNIGVSTTPAPSTPPPPPPPSLTQQKSALNLTQLSNGQPTNAINVTAQPGDTIRYTLSTTNSGGSPQQGYVVQDNIGDILEYADVIDKGGATISPDANGQQIITWPATDIGKGATAVKQFVVKVKDPVPTTAQGVSDPSSFDLKMDNVYGNGITVPVATPPAKVVETASQSMPQTGAGTDALIVFGFGALIIYFWTRNRQLLAEVKILRSEYQGGAV